MFHFGKRRVAAVLLVVFTLSVAVPAAVLAKQAQSLAGRSVQQASTVFSLGRQGGNIRPFTISIYTDGTVKIDGPVQSSHPTTTLSKVAIAGLVKLAKAEGFFALPDKITGTHVLPDFAGRVLTVNASGSSKTVIERGAANSHFDQLYAVLMAVVGATS